MNRELFAGVGVLVAVAIAGWLSTAAINGGPLSNPYRVQAQLPAGAPAMKDGDEVRIAGQRAGQIRAVEPGDDGGALVTLELEDQHLRDDARVRVRLRGLAGAVYLEVEPGTTGRELDSGEQLPVTGDASADLTDVIETFDRSTRTALSQSLRG